MRSITWITWPACGLLLAFGAVSLPVDFQTSEIESLTEGEVQDLALEFGQTLYASDMTPEELAGLLNLLNLLNRKGLLTDAASANGKLDNIEYDYNIAANENEELVVGVMEEEEEDLYYPEEDGGRLFGRRRRDLT